MPPFRRLLAWAVLALVVVVGSALGRGADVAAPVNAASEVAMAQVTSVAEPVGDAVHLQAGADDDARPCVLRADCAGAWTFGTAGLLLAVAVAVPSVGLVPTVSRVPARRPELRSALLPSGLYRPPRPS